MLCKQALAALLIGGFVWVQTNPGLAQSNYPSAPIRVIIPLAPGGAIDVMVRALGKAFLPNAVVLLRRGEQVPPDIVKIADFTRNQPGIAGKATAYVCVNYACRAPTTDITEMLNQLGVRAAAKAGT